MANPFDQFDQKNEFEQFEQAKVEQKPQPKAQYQDPQSAALESLMQFGSGMVAEPIAGLAGILQAINPFASEGAGASTVKSVKEALSYKPRGLLAKEIGKQTAEALKPVGEAIKATEQFTGDIGYDIGGATGGAIGKTVPTALLEFLGLKGIRTTRGAKGITGITDDVADRLERSGVSLDDLSDANIKQIQDKIKSDYQSQVDRLSAFEKEGVQPTRGDIGQAFEQQKLESQLFETVGDAGDQMRRLRAGQSEQLRRNLESMVDDLGVSQEVGASVKSALSGRKELLSAERSDLYKKLAEESNSINIPIMKTGIMESLPDARTLRDISNAAPNASRIVEDALKDYGLLAGGQNITPLSLSNFEGFRKALVRAEAADQTGAIKAVTGGLKRSLDDAIDEAASNVARNGNANIAELAKEARKSHIALKTEFDQKALTDQLIQSKSRGSNVPKFEESQIYAKLSSKSTPIEQFKAVTDSLKKAGAQGQKALADLKTRSILDVIDSAYGAGSRKIAGERSFGSAAFKNKIDDMRPKLEQVFNKQEMAAIDRMYKIADSIQPPSTAVPKGSAGFFVDLMKRTGAQAILNKVPGGGLLYEQLVDLSAKAKNKKAFEKALEMPKYENTVKLLYNEYPSLATALGIPSLKDEDSEESSEQAKN